MRPAAEKSNPQFCRECRAEKEFELWSEIYYNSTQFYRLKISGPLKRSLRA